MLTRQLKEHTKKEHASLEKKLISVLKSITSSEDYLKVLQVFYGYYEGLEKRINELVDKQLLPDLKKRRKAEAILDDMRYIDAGVSAPSFDDLPEIETSYAALGSLYVIEGSTLGGQIISKMVAQRLGLTTTQGLSFFHGYGSLTNEMWEIFKAALDGLSLLPHQEEELISAAKETFVRLEAVLDENYKKY